MARADFATRQRIVQVLLNSVTVYPDRAVVSGVLPMDGNIPDDARLLRPSSALVSCWATLEVIGPWGSPQAA